MLLTYIPANGAQRLPACITSQDSKDMRPLDVALVTQQWPAVRLLISAGALQACPELTQVQRELRQLLLLPDSRRQSGALLLLVWGAPLIHPLTCTLCWQTLTTTKLVAMSGYGLLGSDQPFMASWKVQESCSIDTAAVKSFSVTITGQVC